MCADCEVPLQAGAPPDPAAPQEAGLEVTSSDGSRKIAFEAPDVLLVTLPGQQADYLASALADADIFSLLICEGEQQLCGPGQARRGPLAVTLAVEVYVPEARHAAATEILHASTEQGEVVPPQGVGADLDAIAEAAASTEVIEVESSDAGTATAHDADAASSPEALDIQPEGTSSRFVLLVFAALVVLFLLLAGR